MPKQDGYRLKQSHIAVILLIIALLVVLGVLNFSFNIPGQPPVSTGPSVIYTAPDGTQFTNYNSYLAYMQTSFPATAPEAPPAVTTTTNPASQIQFSVFDWIAKTAVTTATTSADFAKADSNGLFDFMSSADTTTVSTTPDQSTQYFADGDQVVVRTDCTGNPTGGLDYYDGWFYFVVHDGNPVYYLTKSMLQQMSSSPYTYKVNAAGAMQTGYRVIFTSGDTKYWDIGQLFMYPRSSAANFDTYLSYQGTDLASVTDGSTWVDTAAEITANATLASTDEDLKVSMFAGAANIGWGWTNLIVSSSGEIKEYKPIIIMATDMTAIGTQALIDEGWKAINDNTLYAEKGFYKVLTPTYTSKGSKAEFTVNVPIDSSSATASTAYLFKFWLIDMQDPANVAIGSVTTTVATAYGFVTAYGPGAMIQASAYSTSSGASSGRILQAYATTPS